mmetsp:Transcript_7786/g.15094  ORF Transcript_7786/g.15094 Transcript_7786/m.15094 type:complete len:223 (-) Transcript_7786:707-1375(-)
MDRQEHETQSEFEGPLGGTKEQVGDKDGHRQGSKEREPCVEPLEVIVEKGSQRRVRINVDEKMKEPKQTDDDRTDSEKQLDVGDERVVVLVVRRYGLEILRVLFQQVYSLLETQDRLSFITCRLAYIRIHTPGSHGRCQACICFFLSFNLDQFTNIHEFIDAFPERHLGFRKFDGVHMFWSIDKGQDQIQRQRRQSNSTKYGKEEPSKPSHESGVKRTDSHL